MHAIAHHLLAWGVVCETNACEHSDGLDRAIVAALSLGPAVGFAQQQHMVDGNEPWMKEKHPTANPKNQHDGKMYSLTYETQPGTCWYMPAVDDFRSSHRVGRNVKGKIVSDELKKHAATIAKEGRNKWRYVVVCRRLREEE